MLIRLLPLVILCLLRFYDLEIRPPHHDESVNGWFVDGLFNRGYYVYDPANYHGPLFFYVLAIAEKIFGRGVESLRYVTVVFGSLISFTPFLFRRWLGRYGTWIAAITLTLSPALIFYSRYAIHETLFALSCILFFYYWLRVREEGFNRTTMLGFGGMLGAMATLKENFVLYCATLAIAEGCLWLYERKAPFQFTKKFWIGFASACAFAAAIILVFYSGFFQDPNGIPNFFKAFELWFQTGSKGNGHEKPFFYWINVMASFEWYALAGLLLTPLALSKSVPREVRLTSVVGFGLWLLYSIVNYKTPWCELSFYWAFIFVFAYWLGKWTEPTKRIRGNKWLFIPYAAGMCVSVYQAYDVSYVHPDQEGHYYIYGQTFHDFMGPVNALLDRAKLNPDLKNTMHIQVVSSFTWPLPYLLGEFKQVGYFGENNCPQVLDADEIIIDKAFELKFADRIRGNYSRTEVRSRQWAGPEVFLKKNSP